MPARPPDSRSMPEPLDEAVEESWLEFFNRFDTEIYPNIFRPRGIARAEALIVWELSNLRNAVEAALSERESGL